MSLSSACFVFVICSIWVSISHKNALFAASTNSPTVTPHSFISSQCVPIPTVWLCLFCHSPLRYSTVISTGTPFGILASTVFALPVFSSSLYVLQIAMIMFGAVFWMLASLASSRWCAVWYGLLQTLEHMKSTRKSTQHPPKIALRYTSPMLAKCSHSTTR